MRLGKRKEKEKDHSELKSQGVEGITRLICLSKGQNPLKGMIDYNFVCDDWRHKIYKYI